MGGEGFFQGCAPVHVCAFVYTRESVCVCAFMDVCVCVCRFGVH